MSSKSGRGLLTKRLKTYADNSSVHGLKYISEGGRHWTERMFWTLSCLLATWGLVTLASESYDNFLYKPVSFLVDRDRLHWNTSFPAVSVCEADSDLGALSVSTTRLFGMSHDLDLETFLRDIVFFDGKCYSCEELCDKTINCTEDLYYLINHVRQPCRYLLSDCLWMGQAVDCCEFFQPLVTETGFCYTANSVHMNGPIDKFTFVLNMQTGPGQLIFKVTRDVNVYIHNTEDVPYINIPQEAKNMIVLGTELKMTFAITEIANDPMLSTLPVDRRKCRFSFENTLDVYKHYSYSGCVVNCRAQAQFHFCNCTHHYMPKIAGFKTCTIKGLACLSKLSKTIGSIKSIDSDKPGLVCPCIPSCTEHDHQVVEKIFKPYEDGNYSLIRIEMSSLPTTRFRRYIVRSKLDLVGGTAGLFLGASLLSLAEWFDFMIFRKLMKKHIKTPVAPSNNRTNPNKKRKNGLYLYNLNCNVKREPIHYLP